MTSRFLALCLLLLCSILGISQTTAKKPAPAKRTSVKAALPADIAPDLDQRLARFKPVVMPFHQKGLTPNEVKLVGKLVEATNALENIFWRQSDPDGLAMYHSLAGNPSPEAAKLRHFLIINGSRYDLISHNQPFVGKDPMSPGHGLYPAGLTRDQIEAYVAQHPEQKAAIYDPLTVIRRKGDALETVRYHVVYQPWLEKAAKSLREAAALSDDKAFANFLRLRADALLSDNYYPSDLAWMDLQDPKFDIIFAPYETYLDDVLGVKGSYGAAVMVRNEEESAKLHLYIQYIPDIQESFPLAPEDKPSKKNQTMPMEVMDTPFRGGDLRHGYQAVADNLPNDPKIHEQKGTKKLFFKNFMDARVNFVVLPIAKRLMRPEDASKASEEGYLAVVVMHEISHGLGPAYARIDGKKVDIREAIGPTYGALEEAKADIVGLFGLHWLMEHGVVPKARAEEYYASQVAGIFRTVRFSTAEAHGRAEMMEFNYFSEQGAITRDADGKYGIDFQKMPGAVASLAKELLEIEATGDRKRAESWFARYDSMPPALQSALQTVQDVPVDVDPQFAFREPIQ